MHVYDVLIRPVVTEKSVIIADGGQYVFEVDARANKMQIKDAVETAFNVTVYDVNTMIMPAKISRRGSRELVKKAKWKKAVVTLKPGDRIQVFEGV
ncbi:MAG: 50S ribosomal protein L23 [Caldilineaceae bacterium]